MIKITFEEKYEDILREIEKRRPKWTLKAIPWLDFEDVIQIILHHISIKWRYWDQERELLPWVNRIISNQFKNILRNHYYKIVRPCLHCKFYHNEDCSRYPTGFLMKCAEYNKWHTRKKSACDIRMPLPLETHVQEVYSIPDPNLNTHQIANDIHEKMKHLLKRSEWRVYEGLYIRHKTEEFIAKEMGYRTSECNRAAGHKRILQIKKVIMAHVRTLIKDYV